MILQTRRLVLRPWERRDIDILPQIANDRRIWRNLRDGFPHPYDRACAEHFVSLCENGTLGHTFAIECEGHVMGGIGVHPFDDVYRKTAEIGYWLGVASWGQGYATEAVHAIIRYGFDVVEMERLQAGVYAWNEASAHVLEKAGFEFEGRLRRQAFKDGQFVDVLFYARLRSQ